jgi:hypothetical protein
MSARSFCAVRGRSTIGGRPRDLSSLSRVIRSGMSTGGRCQGRCLTPRGSSFGKRDERRSARPPATNADLGFNPGRLLFRAQRQRLAYEVAYISWVAGLLRRQNQRRNRLCRSSVHARRDVRVGLKREGRVRVAEPFADDLGGHAVLQCRCGVGVANVVKSDFGQASRLAVLVEQSRDGVRGKAPW